MLQLADTLSILADGEFHSGEHLAQQLNVTRASVWKYIDAVRQAGLDVFAVRGKGYRLSQPFELINKDTILRHVTRELKTSAAGMPQLEVFWSLDSTNAHTLAHAKQGLPGGYTCIAEQQTQGRGRRGRVWQSPIGGNIYLSQYWQLSEGLNAAGGLSLAVAVALVKALRSVLDNNVPGINAEANTSSQGQIGVKWPNDIVYQDKKLAGILVEISGEPSGPCHVVIGIGINVYLPESYAVAIEQPWTDLQSITAKPVARNQLIARLIIELQRAQQAAEQGRLHDYLQQWRTMDAYHNRPVVIHSAKGEFQGVVRGIDDSGALQLACDGKLLHFHSGEVSLRAATRPSSRDSGH